MRLDFSKRPSPALIVAVCALAFAMVGTAVASNGAVSKITKSKVKSISKKQADKELKANVAGSHVNTADKATNADSATNATNAVNAVNVGGLRIAKFSGQSNVAVTDQVVFTGGGLTLQFDCFGAGTNIDIQAVAAANNGRISQNEIQTGSTAVFSQDNDFDAGQEFDLMPGGTDIAVGTMAFHAADGTVATAEYRADEGGAQGCTWDGTITFG
jgi:hypothetical protein